MKLKKKPGKKPTRKKFWIDIGNYLTNWKFQHDYDAYIAFFNSMPRKDRETFTLLEDVINECNHKELFDRFESLRKVLGLSSDTLFKISIESEYDYTDVYLLLEVEESEENYNKRVERYEKEVATYEKWYEENEEDIKAELKRREEAKKEKAKERKEKKKQQLKESIELAKKKLKEL